MSMTITEKILAAHAITVNGLQDALDRGRAYAEAGADMLFIEAPSPTDLPIITNTFKDVRLLFNKAMSGKTPFLPFKQIGEMGFKLIIVPGMAMAVVSKQLRDLWRDVKQAANSDPFFGRGVSLNEFHDFMGRAEMHELETKYGA